MSRTRKESSVRTCRSQKEKCQTFISGFAWKITDTGFDRYMIRRCLKCGERNVQKVHWVEMNRPTCMSCLSQIFINQYNDLEDELIQAGTCDDYWPLCQQCNSGNSLVLRI